MIRSDFSIEKQELFSVYSDVYKDVNGFRPHMTIEELSNYSVQALSADIDRLQANLEVQLEREKVDKLMAASRFEELIAETITHGAGDRFTAVRWLRGSGDFDQMLYDNGILGTQYGQELEFECGR